MVKIIEMFFVLVNVAVALFYLLLLIIPDVTNIGMRMKVVFLGWGVSIIALIVDNPTLMVIDWIIFALWSIDLIFEVVIFMLHPKE